MDPHRSIIRWGWTRHRKYHERYMALSQDPAWSHLQFIRLTTPRQVRDFLAAQVHA